MNVGRITYINCYPVYGAIDRGIVPLDASIVDGIPTALNKRMAEGTLDVSVVSAVEYARDASKYLLLPDLAISCDGPVRSVMLFSKRPAEELTGRTVIVSKSSMTSVALLELLFENVWHAKPNFVPGNAELTDLAHFGDDHEARLVIGDAALVLGATGRSAGQVSPLGATAPQRCPEGTPAPCSGLQPEDRGQLELQQPDAARWSEALGTGASGAASAARVAGDGLAERKAPELHADPSKSHLTASRARTSKPDAPVPNAEVPRYPYAYDLGETWKQWTELPFVFAVWVAQRTTSVSNALKVHAQLIESRNWGVTHLDVLAEQAQQVTGVGLDVCREYLSGLDYGLSYHHLAGLTEFFRRLVQRGRVPNGTLAFLPAA